MEAGSVFGGFSIIMPSMSFGASHYLPSSFRLKSSSRLSPSLGDRSVICSAALLSAVVLLFLGSNHSGNGIGRSAAPALFHFHRLIVTREL